MQRKKQNLKVGPPDIDSVSSRRRALKKFIAASTSIVAGSPLANAIAQSNGTKSLPTILNIILDEPSPPSPESFTLTEDSYTGTATQAFQINANDQTFDLTATASICFDVISSELDQTRVNIEMIMILEGLEAIDARNDDIAIEYFVKKELMNKSIKPNQETRAIARVPNTRNSGLTCGYFFNFPLQLRIENFRPVVKVLEQLKIYEADGETALFLPEFEVSLSPGECAIPSDRTNQECQRPPFRGLLDLGGVSTTRPPQTTGQPF